MAKTGKRPAISESGLIWISDGHTAAPARDTEPGLLCHGNMLCAVMCPQKIPSSGIRQHTG